VLVATVSPAELCMAETLSTLKFAQRAKSIKNSAVQNEESSGSIIALQREIAHLKAQLTKVSEGSPTPAESREDQKEQNQPVMDSQLVLDSLKRCQMLDEHCSKLDIKNKSLEKRLEQSEKNVMGVKMMLKMREQEIQRLKKKEDVGSGTLDPAKVAADAVREEMQCEVLRYRSRVEELERIVAELNKSAPAPWTSELEVKFQHDVVSLVEMQEQNRLELMSQNNRIAEAKFAEEFGFSPAEATEMKARMVAAEKQAAELLARVVPLQQGVISMQKLLEDANQAASKARLDAAIAKEQSTQAIQSQTEEFRRLLADKDEIIKDLESGISKADSELREQQFKREAEHRDKFNKAMKDNTILLKRCRELESALDDCQTTLDVALKNRDAQKVLLENAQLHANSIKAESETKVQSKQAEIDNLMIDLEKSKRDQLDIAATVERLTAENTTLADRVEELELNLQQSNHQLSQARFEADNAIEDADNLYAQTQALIEERAGFIAKIAEQEEAIICLNEKLEESAETLVKAQTKSSELSDQIVSVQSQIDSLTEELQAQAERMAGEKSQALAEQQAQFDTTLAERENEWRTETEAAVAAARAEEVAAMQPQIDSLTEELQAQAERMAGEKSQALAEQQAQFDTTLAERESEWRTETEAAVAAARAEEVAAMQPQIDSLTEELQAQAERMAGEKSQALAEQQAQFDTTLAERESEWRTETEAAVAAARAEEVAAMQPQIDTLTEELQAQAERMAGEKSQALAEQQAQFDTTLAERESEWRTETEAAVAAARAEEVAAMQPQIDSLTEELQAQAERMAGEKSQALAELQSAHAVIFEGLEERLIQYDAEISAATNKITDLEAVIESQTDELVSLRDQVEAEEAKFKKLQLEKAELQAKFDSARQDALRAFNDVEKARAAQTQAEASAAETMAQLMDLEAVLFIIPYMFCLQLFNIVSLFLH
jgi:hypothetical protein